MILTNLFPRLTSTNYRVTSPATSDYNCVAWAAGDTLHWWQPGVYWPISLTQVEFNIAALLNAFKYLGFELCSGGELEAGFDKIAVYGDSQFYTHAALQLPTGKWTSKLGAGEDIEHDTPEDVADGAYGPVVQFLRRPRSTP
jgi:hypothetical protein